MTPDQRQRMIDAMLATSAALSRLSIRMYKHSFGVRQLPSGRTDPNPHWGLADLQPPSPLLEGLNPNLALSGAISLVLGVQARLLGAATSGDEIDPLWACRVLQALGGDFAREWSPLVRRFADVAGIALPAEPRDLHHGLGLSEFMVAGEWRPRPAGTLPGHPPPKA